MSISAHILTAAVFPERAVICPPTATGLQACSLLILNALAACPSTVTHTEPTFSLQDVMWEHSSDVRGPAWMQVGSISMCYVLCVLMTMAP